MKKTKRILLSRELHETLIIRSALTAKAFCGMCEVECVFLTLDSAVGLFAIGTREILSGIEVGEIHTFETPNGQILICAKSVQDSPQQNPAKI